MYFKDEKEKYNSEIIENYNSKSEKFPFWLLVIIIAMIVAVGIALIYMTRKDKKSQNFGFRFY